MQFACAAIGGGLIGVAAVLLMSLSGRIAGISGMIGGLLPPKPEHNWRLRLSFIAGLLLAPMVLNVLAVPNGIGDPIRSYAAMIPAGFSSASDRRWEMAALRATASVCSQDYHRAP